MSIVSNRAKDDASAAPVVPGKDPFMEEKLWSIRFEISERARKEHKENAATLLKENEKLQGSIQQVRMSMHDRI